MAYFGNILYNFPMPVTENDYIMGCILNCQVYMMLSSVIFLSVVIA